VLSEPAAVVDSRAAVLEMLAVVFVELGRSVNVILPHTVAFDSQRQGAFEVRGHLVKARKECTDSRDDTRTAANSLRATPQFLAIFSSRSELSYSRKQPRCYAC
jgi:hypothetical protein